MRLFYIHLDATIEVYGNIIEPELVKFKIKITRKTPPPGSK